MERKPYPTDLTDAQWNKIAPLFVAPKTRGITGRPRQIPYREIVNALFYQAKAGGGWRMLPHDLPKWQTVYYYFRTWTRRTPWPEIKRQLDRRGIANEEIDRAVHYLNLPDPANMMVAVTRESVA